MLHKQILLSTLLFSGFVLFVLQAQESIPATGLNATGIGGSVSYTVGPIATTTDKGSKGSVSQGVQQPFEISVVAGLKESKNLGISVSVYPNPTTDFLQLKVESKKVKEMSFQLFDMQGKLIESKKMDGNQTSIAMSKFVPATYFLKVCQSKKEIKTFKIIKN